MNYIRTSSGCMMAINIKSNALTATNKQKTTAKPNKKLKKDSSSYLK